MKYKNILFGLILLLCVSFVSAGSSFNDTINNTFINTTLYTDILINYDSLIDNTSGIYFNNLEWINESNYRYTCIFAPITIVNQSYTVSDFPLIGWSCVATFIPPFTESTIFTVPIFGIILSIAILLAIVGLLVEGSKNINENIVVIGSVIFYVVSSILLLVLGFALITNGLSINIGTEITTLGNTTTETIIYGKAPVFANYTGFLFILLAIALFSKSYYIYLNQRKKTEIEEKQKVYKFPD